MKQKNLWFLTLVFAVTVTLSSSQRIHAGLVAGDSLNAAQSIVDTFNGLNPNGNLGGGFYFQNTNNLSDDNPTGVVELKNHVDFVSADLSVYDIFQDSVMLTFCVQPDININMESSFYTGRLCYEDGKTYTTNRNGDHRYVLSLGAAYLYKAFVTGEIDAAREDGELDCNDNDIGIAIRTLMGYTYYGGRLTDNPVLSWLLEQEILEYWYEVYDPDIYYNEIGYHSVFVMNVVGSNGNPSQDFLYLALVEPPADHAPEPATILLWTLGTIGTVGYARRRSRLKKQTG